APVTALVLGGLRVFGTLRVPLGNELLGIDLSEHGEHAYDDGEMLSVAGGGRRISEPVVLSTGQPKTTSEAAA
ncbi:MAG: hypothetical protein ABI205_05660, partial [Gemmatimonadaceae bacterium]